MTPLEARRKNSRIIARRARFALATRLAHRITAATLARWPDADYHATYAATIREVWTAIRAARPHLGETVAEVVDAAVSAWAVYAVEKSPIVARLEAAGFSRWSPRPEVVRWYAPDAAIERGYGLRCRYYGTGRVAEATLDGETISNGEATKLLRALPRKLWFDESTGRWHADQGAGYVGDILDGLGLSDPTAAAAAA